jgi:hemoglobin
MSIEPEAVKSHRPASRDPDSVTTDPERVMVHDIRSREDIVRLVDLFYSKAMKDAVIGYIFTDVAQLDLNAHLPVMYNFWESLLLGARTYKGNAMQKHIDLDRLSPLRAEHFERWLLLFESTVNDLFAGDTALKAILTARGVARSMSLRIGVPGPVASIKP